MQFLNDDYDNSDYYNCDSECTKIYHNVNDYYSDCVIDPDFYDDDDKPLKAAVFCTSHIALCLHFYEYYLITQIISGICFGSVCVTVSELRHSDDHGDNLWIIIAITLAIWYIVRIDEHSHSATQNISLYCV